MQPPPPQKKKTQYEKKLNLCLKTEPITVGADAVIGIFLVSEPDIHTYVNKAGQYIYCCIRSNCDRLYFYTTVPRLCLEQSSSRGRLQRRQNKGSSGSATKMAASPESEK